MSAHAKYDTLIAAARALPRLKVAVVHPCDESAIKGALEAAELGLIEPILSDRRQRSSQPQRPATWISRNSRSWTLLIATVRRTPPCSSFSRARQKL